MANRKKSQSKNKKRKNKLAHIEQMARFREYMRTHYQDLVKHIDLTRYHELRSLLKLHRQLQAVEQCLAQPNYHQYLSSHENWWYQPRWTGWTVRSSEDRCKVWWCPTCETRGTVDRSYY